MSVDFLKTAGEVLRSPRSIDDRLRDFVRAAESFSLSRSAVSSDTFSLLSPPMALARRRSCCAARRSTITRRRCRPTRSRSPSPTAATSGSWTGQAATPGASASLGADTTVEAAGTSHLSVIDASGNAVAVWSYFDGARYDIRCNRYDAGGSGWDTVTPSLTATGTATFTPTATPMVETSEITEMNACLRRAVR